MAVEVILDKELPYSTVYRLAVEYQGGKDDPDRPRSLFLKLCGPRAKDSNKELEGIGKKEVEFYRKVAPGMICPPLVRCYDAQYSEETDRSHILLDDLSETHSQPEQGHAPSAEMSRLAVEAAAKAHAHWWYIARSGNGGTTPSSVSRTPHLLNPGGEFDIQKFIENLDKSLQEFLKFAELTGAQRETYRLMLNAAPRIWGRLTRPDHLTVTHGDMHWWNFLYPKDPDTRSVHLFDWHLWHIDLGARDLAFLLALGGFAEPRPEIEEELLLVYHRALGVTDYSWEMLMEDYRWSAIRNLNIPVIFWSQGKHKSTVRDALRRAYAAFDRLSCDSLL